MKKLNTYTAPRAETIAFTAFDVIAASSALVFSDEGVGDIIIFE